MKSDKKVRDAIERFEKAVEQNASDRETSCEQEEEWRREYAAARDALSESLRPRRDGGGVNWPTGEGQAVHHIFVYNGGDWVWFVTTRNRHCLEVVLATCGDASYTAG